MSLCSGNDLKLKDINLDSYGCSFYFQEGVVMDVRIDWLVAGIGVFCLIGGFAIAYFTLGRERKKDDKADGASVATITSDMGYVKSGIEGINTKLEKQADQHLEVIQRLSSVETSVKSAHKRLDYIEESEKEK